MDGDYLVSRTAAGLFKATAALTTELTREAQARHGTYPVATAALGRAMSAALLLATSRNKPQHFTLRVLGDGPLGAVVADTDGSGGVRGYVQNPRVLLPLNVRGKLDVARAVGQGILHISRDLGLKEPYSGSTELISGEIAEDLAWYLKQSEQRPAAVGLGVLVSPEGIPVSSGGFLLELLPGAASLADELSRRVAALPPVTTLLHTGASPEDILELILKDLEPGPSWTEPVYYRCGCSRDRTRRLLSLLGRDTLTEMLSQDGQAEMSCHFCGNVYAFTAEELEAILHEEP